MYYLVLLAGLIFAYLNGMHDGGTVVATAISSRLEPPRKAVIYAGIANFFGAVLLGTSVARTITGDIVDFGTGGSEQDRVIMLFALASFTGSIIWNIITWITRLPSSASHAMIGAMIGSGICAFGPEAVQWHSIYVKVILAMLLSPVLGFAAGFLFLKLQNRLLRNGTMVWNRRISRLNKVTSFLLSFSYGSNDAQKVMGLMAIGTCALTGGKGEIPMWIIAGCGLVLALGTMTGGYNMIKTVGMDICKINVDNSFASQLATISVVTTANFTGIPISTTQVITSSVMGVGTGNTPKSVNWKVIYRILAAWIITIPASGLMAFFLYYIAYSLTA